MSIYLYLYLYLCLSIYLSIYTERERVREEGLGGDLIAMDALHLDRTRVPARERESFIDNLLVRIHFIIVMIRWTGLAPWEFATSHPPTHIRPHIRPNLLSVYVTITNKYISYLYLKNTNQYIWCHIRPHLLFVLVTKQTPTTFENVGRENNRPVLRWKSVLYP